MKKMLRPITAAQADDDTRLKDAIDNLEDDFAYAIAGLEKLGRGARDDYESAITIAEALSSALGQVIDRIADNIQEA